MDKSRHGEDAEACVCGQQQRWQGRLLLDIPVCYTPNLTQSRAHNASSTHTRGVNDCSSRNAGSLQNVAQHTRQTRTKAKQGKGKGAPNILKVAKKSKPSRAGIYFMP